MKAKLTRSYDIGQGITLLSGAEVEIISVMPIPSGTACTVSIEGYGKRIIDSNYLNVDESYITPNYEQRRYEIAKSVLQGQYSNKDMMLFVGKTSDCPEKTLAELAVRQADALIEELKNGKK